MAFVDPTALQQMKAWDAAWQNDGKCRAVFYDREVLDERATHGWVEEREVLNDDGSVRIEKKRYPGAGRPIYKTVPYIKKFTPGDPTNIVDREARQDDAVNDVLEYPREWDAYQRKQEGVVGTPLEMLPGLSKARIEEYKHLPGAPVRTIEELANLADVHAQKFLGFNQDREKARAWLLAAEKAAPLAEVRAQLAEKDQELAAMKERLATLEAAMQAAAAKPAEPEQHELEVRGAGKGRR